jgi:sporulation protein YlmC with PRC-barrel domain
LIFGKYLNKVVKALDAADIGRVVRETRDKIVVFEKNEARYDIPIHEIQQVGANVLIGLHLSDIEDRYKVEPKEPLPPWPK